MIYMSKNERRKFLIQGTYTAKLTSVNKDGPHIVPVWFVLDELKPPPYSGSFHPY